MNKKKLYFYALLALLTVALVVPSTFINSNASNVYKATAKTHLTAQKVTSIPNILQSATDNNGGINYDDNFLSTKIKRTDISTILFKNTLITGDNCIDASAVGHTTGKVNACTYPNYGQSGGTGIIISANGTTTLPTNSYYLFANIGAENNNITKMQINFNNFVVDANTKNMSYMFYRFAFGVNNKLNSITMPQFPADFGTNATNMSFMFGDFALGNVNYSGTIIDWSKTLNFKNIIIDRLGMFLNFNYGKSGTTLITNCSGNVNAVLKVAGFIGNMIQRCVVKFNTDGASIVPDQYVIMGSTVKKPINPVKKGYRFNNWSLDLLGFKIPFSFNIPILTNITLYATWVKNTPKSASVIKVYAPITHFSVIKNKTVKFKYVVLYSNNKIVNKTKKIKYKKIGKKKLTLKYKNKKLKLVIRVANKKVKPNGIKIIKVKSKKLYFLKIKSKDAAYYQFPKFNGKSKINKYGIYKIKKQTVKIKWWGKSFKKKI